MKKLILAAFALTTAASVFAQGTVSFNNRISGAPFNQTGHIWGPGPAAQSTLSIVGIGSNDNPANGAANFSGAGMKLIGDGGTGAVATGDGLRIMGYKTTFAQLLYALGQNQPEASLVPATGVTTFRTGSSLGDIAAINSTLGTTSASSDAPWATAEIVSWDNTSGLYPTWAAAYPAWQNGLIAAGRSALFNVANIGGTANATPYLTSAAAQIGGFSFNLYYITVPEPSMFALAGLGAAALMIMRRRK
jgi:hypothetical protein